MATSVTSAGLKAGADKCILAARPYLEKIALFSTNFSAAAAKQYDALAVEVLASSSEDFGVGAGYTHPTNTIKPATITLNKHRKSTFTIGDKDAITNELAPCWEKFGPKSGEAVGKYAIQQVMALLTYSDRTGTITQATYASLADFTAIMAKVTDAGLDPWQCNLVLTPTAYAALLAVLPAYVKGDNAAINYADVGEFLGFKSVIMSPNASVVSAATPASNGFGFVVPEGAIGVADRVVPPVMEGGNLIEFGTFTDELTGFGFGNRVVVDADQGTCSWTVDCLFGCALTKQSSNGAPGYYQLITA